MAIELNWKTSSLIIQDLQNDVVIDGGAFADYGAPAHAKTQNVLTDEIVAALGG